jgi:hypothetical protein
MVIGSQLHAPTDLLKAKEQLITTGWEAGWTLVRVWAQGQKNKSPKNAGFLSQNTILILYRSTDQLHVSTIVSCQSYGGIQEYKKK